LNAKRIVSGTLVISLAGPFIANIAADPTQPPPDVSRTAIKALAMVSSTSNSTAAATVVMLDTMLGREIGVASAFERNPRPAFIAPSLIVRST
jgi:hypothetical protein